MPVITLIDINPCTNEEKDLLNLLKQDAENQRLTPSELAQIIINAEARKIEKGVGK